MSDQYQKCDFCGAWVSQDKIRRGKAVVVLRKLYCPDCMRDAVRRKAAAAAPPPPPPLQVLAPEPATARPASSPRATRRIVVGEHGCGLYSSDDERRAQMAPYVREGLLKDDGVLYFLDQPTPERILADFRAVGLAVQPFIRNGQLQVVSTAQLLEAAGSLHPRTLVTRMSKALDEAATRGFRRLRIVCDMTWALSSLIDVDRLVDYETHLAALVAGGLCSALCQYNIYRFEASSLHHVRRNHPVMLAKGTAETVLRETVAAR